MLCCLTAAWEVLHWPTNSSRWNCNRAFNSISQIGARLPQNSSVYGFGEQEQHSFKLSTDWVRGEMILLEQIFLNFCLSTLSQCLQGIIHQKETSTCELNITNCLIFQLSLSVDMECIPATQCLRRMAQLMEFFS